MYLYVKWGILVQNTRIITSQCTSRTQLIHRLKMKCTLTLNIYTFFIPYMYMYNHIRLKQKNTSKQTQEIITILSFFIPYITIFVQAEKQIEADTRDNNNTLIEMHLFVMQIKAGPVFRTEWNVTQRTSMSSVRLPAWFWFNIVRQTICTRFPFSFRVSNYNMTLCC